MNDEFKKQVDEAKERLEIKDETASSEEVVDTSEAVVDEVEQEAVKMGWDPNHKGPNFVSAKEFVERGSFFRKIDTLNKKIEAQSNVLKQLETHYKNVEEAAYKKGVHDATLKRNQAVLDGDVNAFNAAEAELNELKAKPPVLKNESQSNTGNVVTQDMLDWVEENKSWFNNSTKDNARMVKEADGLFVLESQDNPTLTQKEILKLVKDKITRLHPEHFENPNKEKAISITPSKPKSVSGKSDLSNKLSDTQKKFFSDAQRAGIKLTLDEYIKQLELTGALRND